jgi:hypothetical protein
VNCVEYIENFLSAHADGELSADDLLDAEQHLRQCLGCRAKLDDERALKRLLREHIEMRAMPDAMRRQLLEALDRAAEEEAGQQSTARPGHAGHRLPGRPMLWAALALAAALATVFVSTRRFLPYRPPLQASTPARDADFDVAIAAFDRFQREFEPNVPSDSPAVLSAAYAQARMPGFIWNFSASGFKFAGGRLDKLPDGRKVTYTFYRGARNSILCTRFKEGNAAAPAGRVEAFNGHIFYRYRGYSLCYTQMPDGGFVCILASRLPLERMIKAVKVALQ